MYLVLQLKIKRCRKGADGVSYDESYSLPSAVFDPGIVSSPATVTLGLLRRSGRIDATAREIGFDEIHEEDVVERAELMVDGGWAAEKYVLSPGRDPDVRVEFSPNRIEMVDSTRMMLGTASRDDGKLFSNTFGESTLYLRHKRTGKIILQLQIFVQPHKERERLMRATVNELMQIAPQTITSDYKGQNLSELVDDWSAGAASFAFPEMELKATESMLADVGPLLFCIDKNPACNVVAARNAVPLYRSRRLLGSAVRKLAVMGGGEVDCLSDVMVPSLLKVKCLNVRAHLVIATFLEKLIKRAVRFVNIATVNLQELSERESELQVGLPKAKTLRYEIEEINKQKIEVKGFEKRARAMKCRLLRLRALNFLVGCKRQLSVFEVSLSDFSYGKAYQDVYVRILSFERKHFWWMPINEGAGLVHSYRRSPNGKTLQRKYSILFESWCCWRLIRAFEVLGCDFGDARQALRKHLARSVVVTAERKAFAPHGHLVDNMRMSIQIIHDYAAYADWVMPDAEFHTQPRPKGPETGVDADMTTPPHETPDFAIVFSLQGTDRGYWVVLDAKSSRYLPFRDVEKQWRYLSHSHRIGVRHRRPWESWLIYSGNASSAPGLECNFDGVDDGRRWNNCDSNKILTLIKQINLNGSCDVRSGISFGDDDSKQYMAEIRANPISAPLKDGEGDPFLAFARVQIGTFRRYIVKQG